MLENIRNVITRLTMHPLRPNLGGHIPSYPRHVRHDAVAMATAVASKTHCIIIIKQLWASGDRRVNQF